MKQTDTPAFRRWFRNSVVVNEDGSPMVVYHGTRSEDPFAQFDLSKTRELGFHFGTRSQARDFTEGFVPDYPGAKLFAPRIYPVYLSIQKPFCMPDVFAGSTIMFNSWLQVDSMSRVGTAPDSNFWKFCTESTIRRHHQMVVDALRKELGSEWVDATWADFRSVLTRLGFDGVVYHNIAEGDSRRSDNIAWIVWNPTQIKSAIGNRGTFDPDDPVITNPLDPRSAKTQIAGTVGTYRTAASMLTGKVLDYGAGLGLGSDAMRAEGLEVDSLEPFPGRWLGRVPPRYKDSLRIPSGTYDGIVSFSVLNVVDREVRDGIVKEVGRLLSPGGIALITARTRTDVSKAKGAVPVADEPGAYLIGIGNDRRFQKGFSQSELEDYVRNLLGSGFTVQANRKLNGASILITKTGMKQNPVLPPELGRLIEVGDTVLNYDSAQGEDFYDLYDLVYTRRRPTTGEIEEVAGMLNDNGVFAVLSGDTRDLGKYFQKVGVLGTVAVAQGPKNPEVSRINAEKKRRKM